MVMIIASGNGVVFTQQYNPNNIMFINNNNGKSVYRFYPSVEAMCPADKMAYQSMAHAYKFARLGRRVHGA